MMTSQMPIHVHTAAPPVHAPKIVKTHAPKNLSIAKTGKLLQMLQTKKFAPRPPQTRSIIGVPLALLSEPRGHSPGIAHAQHPLFIPGKSKSMGRWRHSNQICGFERDS
jgi:hypothetical protein